MKAENKIWADIGTAIGCQSKSMMQTRYKELTQGDGAGAPEKKEGGEQKKEGGKGDKGKPGGKEKGGNKPAAAPAKASSKHGSEVRFTKGEWTTLMEDDMFSFGELQCISELLMQDERHRWLRVASRFTDKTGRRVHPDDIREKFEQMGKLRK